jgi:hypothetical protein
MPFTTKKPNPGEKSFTQAAALRRSVSNVFDCDKPKALPKSPSIVEG